MLIRGLLLTFIALLMTGQAFARKLPDTIVLSPEVMYETKRRVIERDPAIMPAFKKLIEQADRAIKAPAESVVLKKTPPPSGDMHDYWSLSPYWWPNPDSVNGTPYVRRDGERNPEANSEKYDRGRMRRMSTDAITLALAWYLTGNEEYAGKGTALIWSWCCDSVTRANPNMNYAQARSGIDEGHHTGIIETRDLIKVVEAARILEPSHAWSKAVTRKLTAWFSTYADWLQTSTFGQQERASLNNHGTWYDAQLAVYSLYIDEEDDARAILGMVPLHRIVGQIEANGAMPAELDRTRSRHYTFFTLEALFVLAAAGERVGIDLWHWTDASGASIKKAFDFAAPYLAKEETWPFGDIGAYDPYAYTPLFHRAAMVYKEPHYIELLKALPGDKLSRDRAQLFY